MAIHSSGEADAIEVRTTSLAISGVVNSLAAGAAELLVADPDRVLSKRFMDSLEAARAWFNDRLSDDRVEVALDLLSPTLQPEIDPEHLVARLSSSPGRKNEEQAEALRAFLATMVESLDLLIEKPNRSAAEFVESNLGRLSELELKAVRDLQRAREGETSMVLSLAR